MIDKTGGEIIVDRSWCERIPTLITRKETVVQPLLDNECCCDPVKIHGHSKPYGSVKLQIQGTKGCKIIHSKITGFISGISMPPKHVIHKIGPLLKEVGKVPLRDITKK